MTAHEAPQYVADDIEVYNDSTDAEKQYQKDSVPEDDPFGNEESGEVKYRVMKWW